MLLEFLPQIQQILFPTSDQLHQELHAYKEEEERIVLFNEYLCHSVND